jgi:hypothetical protein
MQRLPSVATRARLSATAARRTGRTGRDLQAARQRRPQHRRRRTLWRCSLSLFLRRSDDFWRQFRLARSLRPRAASFCTARSRRGSPLRPSVTRRHLHGCWHMCAWLSLRFSPPRRLCSTWRCSAPRASRRRRWPPRTCLRTLLDVFPRLVTTVQTNQIPPIRHRRCRSSSRCLFWRHRAAYTPVQVRVLASQCAARQCQCTCDIGCRRCRRVGGPRRGAVCRVRRRALDAQLTADLLATADAQLVRRIAVFVPSSIDMWSRSNR